MLNSLLNNSYSLNSSPTNKPEKVSILPQTLTYIYNFFLILPYPIRAGGQIEGVYSTGIY